MEDENKLYVDVQSCPNFNFLPKRHIKYFLLIFVDLQKRNFLGLLLNEEHKQTDLNG